MDEVADWDLHAVVRAFTTASSSSATTSLAAKTAAADLQHPQTCFSSFGLEESHGLFRFQDPFGSISSSSTTTTTNNNNSITCCEELENVYKPFCSNLQSPLSLPPSNNNSNISPGTSAAALLHQPQRQQLILPHQHQQQQQQQPNHSQVIFGRTASLISATNIITPPQSHRIPTSSASNTTSQSQRAKKRKNVLKKVCHVPVEDLSSDMWAWRKYGQKPIKGSPYPRGYYRCSSSKGCVARKQVERNRSDPKMFIVTYTAEHNHAMPTHRNSLAGSTRQKPANTQQLATAGDTTTTNSPNSTSTPTATTPPAQHSSSSPTNSLSPMTEKSESKTEYEDLMKGDVDNEIGLPDMILDDDFFVGFGDLEGTDPEDCIPDQFQASLEFPWLANSSNTATAASGS